MNQFSNSDIICAIATAPGKAGVGIVRISGKNLLALAQEISNIQHIEARFAYFSHFYNAQHEVIDSGLLLYFKAPHSFTGEDVIELQAHGGAIVLQLLLKRCIELGARLALAGEFTKRAFLNDKIDLIQAESIADLIDANSEQAVKMATRSLQGQFSTYIQELKNQIIAIRTLVEGALDFPEEDIDFITAAKVPSRLITIEAQLQSILKTASQGAILQEGVTVMLLGSPNVGKSSLLNALAEEDIAIVTDIAGTTRDIIRERINIEGITLHLIDTAGLRETNDVIESLGIEKSHRLLNQIDMALIVIDPSEGLNQKTQQMLNNMPKNVKKIFIHNKIDLTGQTPKLYIENDMTIVNISVKKQLGLDLLKTEILTQIGYLGEQSSLFLARTRHVNALEKVKNEISKALTQLDFLDFLAEHLKLAQTYLNEITGEFTSDDLLGNIFSQFCIGK